MTITPRAAEVNPEVLQAVEEVQQTFPAARVTASPDGQQGAFVVVDPVPLGPRFAQDETWIGFHITFQYPMADVYPHFVRPDLSRVDGQQLGEGYAPTSCTFLEGRPVIQLSRRSNRLNPAVDTATIKLLKVLQWLNQS